MDNFKDNLEKATAEAMAKGTLKVLKEKHPKLSWKGQIKFDFKTKKFSFSGFTDEENEIIKTVKFE